MHKKYLISILLVLAVLATSCGGGVTTTTTEFKGGELVQLRDDPPTLDPHLASDVPSSVIVIEVFGGLVTLSTDLKVVPDLAESWKISPDGKTYTFTIRRDARFHNGKAVTANDFKWSLERVADPRTQSTTVDTYLGDVVGVQDKLQGKSNEVSGVKVIDDRTLEITIDSPKAFFLSKLTYPTAFVLDRENIESSREWFKTPNGTGPFKLKEYREAELIVLERNPDYHLGPAKLDTVRFLLSGGTPMVMYENNEIHVTGVGLADLDRVRDPSSPLSKELHIAPPSFTTSYLGMNVTKPPLDDIKVRQALAYAMNKDEIASKVLLDRVVPAYGILPPGFPAYNSELRGLRYDPEKAKKLLAESKYGSDPAKMPRITLTVPGALGASVGLDLEAIQAQWRETLGITVDVQQVEWATFLKDLHAFRLQMVAAAWIADYPDPQNFLDLLFHSKSLNNEIRYSNPEVDRLLETARTEPDEKTRAGLYQKAEEIIVNDTPWIPLWYSGEAYVLIKPEVKDYLLLPLIVPRYRFVYLEK
ncbi:MAG: peptide ABC transporter substrate-binding protein [Chloroflexi bacterium]|nr:peptide ABC transporter substrate-binding protein [Chloroflexota bacterium]